jgi:2-methylisocitrate lyase-like PEP mutase family enzyme
MPSTHIAALLEREKGVLLPGAPNALAARIIADLGFKAVYLTGAGLTNMHLGVPDLGFMDLSQVAEHTMAIRGVVDLPLIVDADTGFGNAINVTHTVRTWSRPAPARSSLRTSMRQNAAVISAARN